MAKVFRLYDIQGNNNIVDWQKSILYGSTAIEQIKDPEGATAVKEITSIPSPFARIDLIKTAFREVVERANKNPNDKDYLPLDAGSCFCAPKYRQGSIYHRMVSETLDVAQIFFEYSKQSNNFEIIVWDRDKDLDQNSIFGKTLKRYLESDGTKDTNGKEPYNFSKFKRMYLLNYKGKDKTSQMNIVGATSPATLFFSSANDLSFVTNNVNFGQDRPFDDSFLALFDRDFEFVKYLYAFRKSYKGFNVDFPEWDNYLGNKAFQTNCYAKLTQDKKEKIDEISEISISNYESIKVGEKNENTLEILGKPFHQKTNRIDWKSDFEIKSEIYSGLKPLVLPVEKGNTYEDLRYTTDKWGKENKAPYYDNTLWVNRSLPNDGSLYPYLTVSDFLQSNIICIPYKLNDESFFNGGYSNTNPEEVSYLLPLQNTFFNFFNVKDLQSEICGKKMFEFVPIASGIKVYLRIPIQNGYIEYTRNYFLSSKLATVNDVSIDNNGTVIEKKIGLGVLPLVTFPENVKKHYRIAVFDKGERDVRLTCFKGSNPIPHDAHVVREVKDLEMSECSKEAYVITDNFDRISVSVDDVQGIIIPRFKKTNGNKIFTFAIDFGTTNTHIEYGFTTSSDSRLSNSDTFKIPYTEKQLHRLHTLYADRDINRAFEHYFIPDTIGDKDDFSFPMRSVFAEWNKNNRNEKMYTLANGNIPFLYEKDIFPENYNVARTELKWRGEDDDILVELYLENLFILLRNKVVINGGNLEATKIVWFYPASMDTGKFDNFKNYWVKYYEKYFGTNTSANLITITESAAPYLYYKYKKGKNDVVTIDVGGGTTDAYIVENGKPTMLLSFLFASLAIFGDGGIGGETRWDSDNNGFVQRYYKEFVEILNSCKHDDLVFTLKQIESRHNSPDIIAFLFSLIGNKEVNNNAALDLLHKLSNNKNFKYVFIVFYGAVLYFIAKSMKLKGLKCPTTLAFSGNGSKTLRVLSSNNETIGRYAKLIFQGVFEEQDSKRLEIIFEDEPKKATCKGGILNLEEDSPTNINKIKFLLVGNDMNKKPTNDLKYEQITEEVQNEIVDSVINFIDFLFDLHDNNDEFFTKSLNANENILDKVKEICTDREELTQSLKAFLSHKKGTKKVEETLFFYPLIGVMHELAQNLNKM